MQLILELGSIILSKLSQSHNLNVCRPTVHTPSICSIEAGKYFRIFSVQRK